MEEKRRSSQLQLLVEREILDKVWARTKKFNQISFSAFTNETIDAGGKFVNFHNENTHAEKKLLVSRGLSKEHTHIW